MRRVCLLGEALPPSPLSIISERPQTKMCPQEMMFDFLCLSSYTGLKLDWVIPYKYEYEVLLVLWNTNFGDQIFLNSLLELRILIIFIFCSKNNLKKLLEQLYLKLNRPSGKRPIPCILKFPCQYMSRIILFISLEIIIVCNKVAQLPEAF